MNNTTDKPTVIETSETNPVNQAQPAPEVTVPKKGNAGVWQTGFQSWCRLLVLAKKAGWRSESYHFFLHEKEYRLSVDDAKALAAALDSVLLTLSDAEMPNTTYEGTYEWTDAQFWQGTKQKAHLCEFISLAKAGSLDVSEDSSIGPYSSVTVSSPNPQESSMAEALLAALEADLKLREEPCRAAVIQKADGFFRYGSAKSLMPGETVHRFCYRWPGDDWAWIVYHNPANFPDTPRRTAFDLLENEKRRRAVASWWAKESLKPATSFRIYNPYSGSDSDCVYHISNGDVLLDIGCYGSVDWVAIVRQGDYGDHPVCIRIVDIAESEAVRLRDDRERRRRLGETLPELTAEEDAAVRILCLKLDPFLV